MRLKIPFDSRFRPWMLEGVKIFDPRSNPIMVRDCGQLRHALTGDQFHAFGQKFILNHIDRQFTLDCIANNGYRMAGFSSTQDFIDYWAHYHSLRGFDPNFVPWLYWFEPRDGTRAAIINSKNWCPFCPVGDPDPNCPHFMGYAGQAEPHPDNVVVNTSVARRIYRRVSPVCVLEGGSNVHLGIFG